MDETAQNNLLAKRLSTLPNSLDFYTFTAARIKEIETLRKAVNGTTTVKLAFQKLPKHMRRRAMSHNVKRLPRRLREVHMNQMKKSGMPPKAKKSTRKYRRRPANLLSEYARRRRRIKWLKTHIWHAKRFHMIEKWGYKIPYQPCDKSFRACFRATTQHCLLQDISYIQCIEIAGQYEEIIGTLSILTDSRIGLTFGARCFSTGKKHGYVTLFHPQSNTHQCQKIAIGQVEFLWKYAEQFSSTSNVLWIFVHPSFYKELLEVFIKLFELKLPDAQADNIQRNSIYMSAKNITLKELQYDISRLRLTGPLSTAVIKNAFKPFNFEQKIPEQLPSWCQMSRQDILIQQNEVFTQISNVSYLPPQSIFSVIIDDPRLHTLKKRTKSNPISMKSSEQMENMELLQQNLPVSLLWSDEVRNYLQENVTSIAKINELRSQLLIPGSDLQINGAPIPIILLWRNGKLSGENLGYASGWDIILPANWTQAIFLALNMWGARVGGLRETELIAFEKVQCDILPPDTVAGRNEDQYQDNQMKAKYFRLPPNKRTNFNKFATVSPFSFEWALLLNDWSDGEKFDGFFVLRDRLLIKLVHDFFKSKSASLPNLPQNCLIPVQLLPVRNGVIRKYASICIPTNDDYENVPVEPKRCDPFRPQRNKMRKEHQALLRKLKSRRKKAKSLGEPIQPTDLVMLSNYQTNMRKLWLPEPTTIRKSCSREIIGFIQRGGFSYTIGKTRGVGYIAASCLRSFCTLKKRNIVLLRNTNSRQFRTCLIDVTT